MAKIYNRIFVIPDIHGRLDLLQKAVNFIRNDLKFDKNDLLVQLGDFIDRGPDSCGCITLLMAMSEADDNIHVLRGNHESFMIDSTIKKNPAAEFDWEMNGGVQTIESYQRAVFSGIPNSHLEWLAFLPISLEVQGFYFSHSPVPEENNRTCPKMPYSLNERTWTYYPPSYFVNGKLEVHKGPLSENGTGDTHLIGIHGHIHHGEDTKVRTFPNLRFLDCGAGCYEESPLVVHDAVSNESWYVFADKIEKESVRQP